MDTTVFRRNTTGNWTSEEAEFSELKDGNQTFYLVDPIANPDTLPCWPATHPQEPDTLVWVMCETWLLERLGYNPCLKKPERTPGEGLHPAVRNLINSKGADWF